MTIEQGGKTVYGASVGILMLETRFPRIHGDIANALTWPFPVQYRIVPNASPDRVVRHRASGLVDGFVAAARDLERHGVDGLTTNCGFLSLIQESIQDAVNIPVAASSLMQAPLIDAMLPPGRRCGIVTISRASLSRDHLRAAGVAIDTPITGTEGGREFSKKILDDEPSMDFARCREDVLNAAQSLVDDHREVGAVLLECTNMVPYAADIRKMLGMPVYSIYSMVCWFQSGLMPRRFCHQLDDPVH